MASSSMLNAKLPANIKREYFNEEETEYNNLQPFLLESSDEENSSFYDSSYAFFDSWRKFDFLTSSSGDSPVKKSAVCEDGEDQPRNFASVGAAVQNVDISGILKRMRTESLSLSQQKNVSGSHAQLILREDFMWSAPGLEALGFGSGSGSSSKVAEKQQQSQEKQQVTASLDATVHAKPTTCIDPVQVFMLAEPPTKNMDSMDTDDSDLSDDDYDEGSDERSPGVTSRINVKAEVATDDDTDEGEGDSDDDDEEVDVVSLNKGQQQQELRFQTAAVAAAVPYRRRSAGDPSPSSAVITADVAAMHNYSNRSTAPPPTASASSQVQAGAGNKRPAAGGPLARSTSLLVKRPRLSAPSSPVAANEVPSWRARHGPSKTGSLRHHHHGYHHHHANSGGGCQRRELHNVLERKRRDDLRGNFNGLRDMLPNVQAKERMPKVTILRRSCDYIRSLRRSFHDLSAEMHRLRQRQSDLRARLRDLGGDAAAAMQMACEDDDTAAHWG